jgi:hypothetical protein
MGRLWGGYGEARAGHNLGMTSHGEAIGRLWAGYGEAMGRLWGG